MTKEQQITAACKRLDNHVIQLAEHCLGTQIEIDPGQVIKLSEAITFSIEFWFDRRNRSR